MTALYIMINKKGSSRNRLEPLVSLLDPLPAVQSRPSALLLSSDGGKVTAFLSTDQIYFYVLQHIFQMLGFYDGRVSNGKGAHACAPNQTILIIRKRI